MHPLPVILQRWSFLKKIYILTTFTASYFWLHFCSLYPFTPRIPLPCLLPTPSLHFFRGLSSLLSIPEPKDVINLNEAQMKAQTKKELKLFRTDNQRSRLNDFLTSRVLSTVLLYPSDLSGLLL